MRVGIYDPYLDDAGGGEKYMLSMAECLAAENKVDIFWDSTDDLAFACKRFAIDITKLHKVKNIFSRQTPFLKRFMASRRYDAIIVLSDGSIPLLGSKKLYIHLQQPLQHFQRGSLKSRIKLSRVTKFICNSEYTKKFIGDKFGLKTIVLYPPVRLDPIKTKKENIILHVGRFRPFDKTTGVSDYKKQDIMLKTFMEMVDNGLKNWKFLLAVSVQENDAEAFEKMRKMTRDYPVEFEINMSNHALWEHYSKAKIYWHASGYGEDLTLHPEAAEHFGISTVEAMGAGCVPVVINAGGQKEIVTNGVNGFTWDTLDALKEQTMALIDSPKLLEKLGEQAKKRADDFSLEKFNAELQNLINT